MGRKLKLGPQKECAYCGKILVRKRYKQSMEDFNRFSARRYCNKKCFAMALIKEEVGKSRGMQIARKLLGDKCSECGNTENLDAHHIDRNRSNNRKSNIQTLCHACHMKLHWDKGDIIAGVKPRQKCIHCDRVSVSRGLCGKHYSRWKTHGDPLVTMRQVSGSGNGNKGKWVMIKEECFS